MKNYYDILGISPDADDDTIKIAYRKLSKKLHPDINGSDDFFDEMFKNINEAYSILGDKTKRNQYDKSLINGGNNNYGSSINNELLDYDSLCIDAIVLILIYKQASSALLQRKLTLGYTRAGSIMDDLASLGLISEFNNDTRTILVTKQGAIDLLNKKVRNFSVSEFLAKYEMYEHQTDSTLSLNKQPKIAPNPLKNTSKKSYNRHYSVWDSVKRWKRIKNIMWLLNICLVLCYLYAPKISLLKTITSFHYYTTGRVNSDKGLNLRAEPNSTAKIVTSIPYYETVDISGLSGPAETIAGREENWIEVEYDGYKGWVWGGYVDR